MSPLLSFIEYLRVKSRMKPARFKDPVLGLGEARQEMSPSLGMFIESNHTLMNFWALRHLLLLGLHCHY